MFQNGQTLKELALSKGTEHIIRLILQIDSSMVTIASTHSIKPSQI